MLHLLISLIKRVLFTVLFLVILWVAVNRIYVAVFAWAIWWFDRWVGWLLDIWITLIVFIFLILIFPFFYIWNIKFLAVASVLQTLWTRYRKDFMELVVGRAVKTSLTLRNQSSALVSTSQERFADLPRPVRWFFDYIKQKLPFISQVEEVLAKIDREREWTEDGLQNEVMGTLEQSVSQTALPVDRTFIFLVMWINALVLIGLYVLIVL